MKIFSRILTVFVFSLSFFSYSFFTYDEYGFCPSDVLISDEDGVIWFIDEPEKVAELKKQKEEREKLKDVGNLMYLILQEDFKGIKKVLGENPELMFFCNDRESSCLNMVAKLNMFGINNWKLFLFIFNILFKKMSEDDFYQLREKLSNMSLKNLFDVFCVVKQAEKANNLVS